ncbi:hypothetical protein GCM10009122_60910 [Fulvivirga kasyanovii]|uniref:Uncharacterized protein n=1 Tax=Fulvivirga kasyanovii TaxID=396812 RepID=A0ABW9RTF7_9BACT|nr:hypothetical protein [Fulvivirga kasyanovii]MTI26967.1 hypothetical protein [Fulvivirga kasyanovii]
MRIISGLLIVLSFVFVQCGAKNEVNANLILVELYPDRLILEQKQIKKNDFEEELKTVVDKKIDEGFKKDELTIVLKVEKNTRRGDVADVEMSMRRLNVRKLKFSIFEKKTSTH